MMDCTVKDSYTKPLKSKLASEYPHIKLEDINLDSVTGKIQVCFIQTPRGVHIREEIQENTFRQVQNLITAANQCIKKMAFEDMIKWCLEESNPINMNGMDIIFDSTVPNDTIIMNPSAFPNWIHFQPPIIIRDTK